MWVRKVRGQNKFGTVRLTQFEAEMVRKRGITIEEYIKAHLVLIAKKRRWKWFFIKEKKNA